MLLSDLLWSPGPWEAVKDDVYGKSSCQADPLHARGGSRSALVIGGSRSALVSHQARVFFLFSGFAAELEVQRWLASNGFALPISERPATPQCFQKDLLDSEGFTPLLRACKVACNDGVSQNSKLARVLEYFLSGSQPGYRPGELDATTPPWPGTRPPAWAPIHLLAEAKGAGFLVQKLISAEADVAQQITGKKKSNALFRAVGVANLELVHILIGTGKFDKRDRNWNNKTYVDACKKSSGATQRALESWGAKKGENYGESGRQADPLHARGASGYPTPASRRERAKRWLDYSQRSMSPNLRRSLKYWTPNHQSPHRPVRRRSSRSFSPSPDRRRLSRDQRWQRSRRSLSPDRRRPVCRRH